MRYRITAFAGSVLLLFVLSCGTDNASTNSERGRTTPLPDSFRGTAGLVLLDSLPRYTGYSFFVTLREGYAVSDLKKLDDESGLPLSSATYDAHAAYGGDIVINFTCCYDMLDDAEKTAATLKSLPPVLHARPVALAVMSRRARP